MRALFQRRHPSSRQQLQQHQPQSESSSPSLQRVEQGNTHNNEQQLVEEEGDPGVALLEACSTGQLHVIQALLQRYNPQTTHPTTTTSNSHKTKRNLVRRTRDRVGSSPLHVAAAQGHYHIVQYLVEQHNARIHVKNGNGHTPATVAKLCDHPHIVHYLHQRQRQSRHSDPRQGNHDGTTAAAATTQGRPRTTQYGRQWSSTRTSAAEDEDETATSFSTSSSRGGAPESVQHGTTAPNFRQSFQQKQTSLTFSQLRSFREHESAKQQNAQNKPHHRKQKHAATGHTLHSSASTMEESSLSLSSNGGAGSGTSPSSDLPHRSSHSHPPPPPHVPVAGHSPTASRIPRRPRGTEHNGSAPSQPPPTAHGGPSPQRYHNTTAAPPTVSERIVLPPGCVVGILLDDHDDDDDTNVRHGRNTITKTLEAPPADYPSSTTATTRRRLAQSWVGGGTVGTTTTAAVTTNQALNPLSDPPIIRRHSERVVGRGTILSEEEVPGIRQPAPEYERQMWENKFITHATEDQQEEIRAILATKGLPCFFLAFSQKLYDMMAFCATLAPSLRQGEDDSSGRPSFAYNLLQEPGRMVGAPCEIAADPLRSLFSRLAESEDLRRRQEELRRVADTAAALSCENGEDSLKNHVLQLAIYAARGRATSFVESQSLSQDFVAPRRPRSTRNRRLLMFRRLSRSLYGSLDNGGHEDFVLSPELSQYDRWAREEGYVHADIALDVAMREPFLLGNVGDRPVELVECWAAALLGLDDVTTLPSISIRPMLETNTGAGDDMRGASESLQYGQPMDTTKAVVSSDKKGSDTFHASAPNELRDMFTDDDLSLSEQDRAELSEEMGTLFAEQREAIQRLEKDLIRTASVGTQSIQGKRLCELKRKALTKLWVKHDEEMQVTRAFLDRKRQQRSKPGHKQRNNVPLSKRSRASLRNMLQQYEEEEDAPVPEIVF